MKLTSSTQRQGNYYEQQALQFLLAQGLLLVAKNWHYKNLGELDLVMLDRQSLPHCLVVIEVRQRKHQQFGSAQETITQAKQQRIIQVTQAFLQENPQFENLDIRFDVVSFIVDFQENFPIITEWVTSAFLAEG